MAITKNRQSEETISSMAKMAFPDKQIAEIRELTEGIREAKGMTQMGFAEKLNISRSYMNKIEKGTKTASIDLLIEIAVYGWVTLDYLILRQSLAAVQVKENIRMMREALNVLEQSL